MDWRHRAACRDEDPELFFPIGNTGPALLQIEEAKAVCRRCPVIDALPGWALETGQDAGVWGGLSEDERRALKRRSARARARHAPDPQTAALDAATAGLTPEPGRRVVPRLTSRRPGSSVRPGVRLRPRQRDADPCGPRCRRASAAGRSVERPAAAPRHAASARSAGRGWRGRRSVEPGRAARARRPRRRPRSSPAAGRVDGHRAAAGARRSRARRRSAAARSAPSPAASPPRRRSTPKVPSRTATTRPAPSGCARRPRVTIASSRSAMSSKCDLLVGRHATASRGRSRWSRPGARPPPAPIRASGAPRPAGPAAAAARRPSAGCSSPGGGSRGSSRPW